MRIGLATAVSLMLSVTGTAGTTMQTLPISSAAPTFARPDLQHKMVSLDAYRGKVVLLKFRATWCEPCRDELPRFAAWQQTYGARGLRVIAVSMDDNEAPVHAFYQKLRLNFPVLMGRADLGNLYGGVFGLPMTYVIDRRGKIRFEHVGAARLEALEGEIGKLLVSGGR